MGTALAEAADSLRTLDRPTALPMVPAESGTSPESALTWLAELGFEENEEMKKMKVKGKEWLENPKETINSPPGRRPPSSVAVKVENSP